VAKLERGNPVAPQDRFAGSSETVQAEVAGCFPARETGIVPRMRHGSHIPDAELAIPYPTSVEHADARLGQITKIRARSHHHQTVENAVSCRRLVTHQDTRSGECSYKHGIGKLLELPDVDQRIASRSMSVLGTLWRCSMPASSVSTVVETAPTSRTVPSISPTLTRSPAANR